MEKRPLTLGMTKSLRACNQGGAVNMATIAKIYRTRIDYEADVDTFEAIENKAFAFAKDGIEVETFMGCPACGPYLSAESESEESIIAWAGKVERYIQRRKGATLSL